MERLENAGKALEMNEEILKQIEHKVDRRHFLRGSALAAAAIVGVAAAAPVMSFAQGNQQDTKKPDNKTRDEKKPDEKNDDRKDEKKPDDTASDDPTKVTLIGEDGRPYRVCPVCGSNMYRQDETWTCENCGYSYTE